MIWSGEMNGTGNKVGVSKGGSGGRAEASGWWPDDKDGLIDRRDVIVRKRVLRRRGV